MKPRPVGLACAALVTLAIVAGAASPAAPDPRADLFVRRKCNDCHAITGLGLRAIEDVGPDLTYAYGDVVIRYGTNLESFLKNPIGVMRLVLVSHLDFSAAERDSMVQVLKDLYIESTADLENNSQDRRASWIPSR